MLCPNETHDLSFNSLKTWSTMKTFNLSIILILSISIYSNANYFPNPITLTVDVNEIYHTDDNATIHSDCPVFKAKCKGTKKWKDGTQYSGEMKFGQPHGKGRLTWTDESYYDGEFRNGIPNGNGKRIYPDDSVYDGEWFDGLRDGKGVYTFACGDEYFGEFREDLFNGNGSILLSSGESYQGEWKNGLAHGHGEFTRLDGSKYIGDNKKGERHGDGKIVWETGDTLAGTWNEGKLEDEVVFNFQDGSMMLTVWNNGEMENEATYITSDGEEFKANANELAEKIITNNLDLMESTENNLQLAFLGVGMEYRATLNYGAAEESFQFAMEVNPDFENSELSAMVGNQLANLQKEKEQFGVANANK